MAPIPFNKRVLKSALNLKNLGLDWQPHVGCFVWDEQKQIGVPSPFPDNVYFILSLPRFTTIFGSIENIKKALVWVPTWHQAVLLNKNGGMARTESVTIDGAAETDQPDAHLLQLYNDIANHLRKDISAKKTGASDG